MKGQTQMATRRRTLNATQLRLLNIRRDRGVGMLCVEYTITDHMSDGSREMRAYGLLTTWEQVYANAHDLYEYIDFCGAASASLLGVAKLGRRDKHVSVVRSERGPITSRVIAHGYEIGVELAALSAALNA
jgi:hypothetical protein